ncbi:MAG: dehydrogenase [Acidobacteria bacterium]|nr:dehydrogenase [Acidobacteriota bacterium]
MSETKPPFRVGLTPDFPAEARGRYESDVEDKLGGVAGLTYEVMPSYEALHDYDAVLALKITANAATLAGVDRTAVIARWGVGYDTIDTDAMTASAVALAITPQAVRRPVAEAILTFVFALAKQVFLQDRITRQGVWRNGLVKPTICLEGRTLGSVGCGNIAREMFRLAGSLGFGRYLACDPHVSPAEAAALGIELVSMDEVFAQSDFVAVNTLLNPDTKGLVGAEHFRLMKPTAYFINTARGPIVREADLIEALRERRIAGAGIDVFEQEPPAPDNPLFELDNVIVSPHGMAWTEEISRDNTREACDNILEIFRGEAPHGLVNRAVLDQPGFQAKLARFRA